MIDSFSGEYSFLSNFYPVDIQLGNLIWPTTEHLYQAAKTNVKSEIEQIRLCKTPGKAKQLGKNVTLRNNWNEIRVPVMRKLISLKFKKGTNLAELLLQTGDEQLVEGNYWNDRFWGVCRGQGQNVLGKLLEAQRTKLRVEEYYNR